MCSVAAPEFWGRDIRETTDGAIHLRAGARWAKAARARISGGSDPRPRNRFRSFQRWAVAKGFRGELEPRSVSYGRTKEWAMELADEWISDHTFLGRGFDEQFIAALREWSKESS